MDMMIAGNSSVGQQRSVTAHSSARLMRLNEVKDMVGLGKTSIYGLISADRFPKPCHPSAKAARWIEQEVVNWVTTCGDNRK
jgi:prophage regulatory protein